MIYAISDLHLGFSVDKPMDKFGEAWINHTNKIKQNWERTVKDGDTVIIPGDISWALHLYEAQPDLQFIDNFPGQKLLLSGNHDHWWDTVKKMDTLGFSTLKFMKFGYIEVEGRAICVSRGWVCPGDAPLKPEDDKIYMRELMRVETALKTAISAGYSGITLAMHFPPTNRKLEPSGFTELIERYGVSKVVYGHLHGEDDWRTCRNGKYGDTEYVLVAADYLNFTPISI